MENNEMLLAAFTFATIIVPIAGALVELVKQTVSLPKNYLPLLSFVIGIIVAILAYPFTDLDLTLRIWAGAFAGLASTGLFELGTRTIKQVKPSKEVK